MKAIFFLITLCAVIVYPYTFQTQSAEEDTVTSCMMKWT